MASRRRSNKPRGGARAKNKAVAAPAQPAPDSTPTQAEPDIADVDLTFTGEEETTR
jgi:hypothetical protein